MVEGLPLWTEVVQVSKPLCFGAQIATEAEGLHSQALSNPVLPGAEEFHHQELGRQRNKGMRGVVT